MKERQNEMRSKKITLGKQERREIETGTNDSESGVQVGMV